MYYVLTFLLGLPIGAICMYLYVSEGHSRAKKREEEANAAANLARQANDAARAKESDLNGQLAELTLKSQQFEHRVIKYQDLQAENSILKRDLQNIDIQMRKIELDGQARDQKQKQLDERSTQLAQRYLTETVKSVVSSIGPSNFTRCKDRLIDVIAKCREIGFAVSASEETKLISDLRSEFEKAVKAEFEREEQARIKAQIREEERLKREIERELAQIARERTAIQAALDQALAEANGQHTAEVERLQQRLTEAEEKSKRALSMAQQTKAGNVYILSNIGTFGQGVFKVGMTRRLEPMERVDELGCASVPFPFDVHAMIRCDDAPALENAIHRALNRHRINKANPRKEFFRTEMEVIKQIVRQHHGKDIDFIADPEALEYRQTLTMSEQDAEYIEKVYDSLQDEPEITPDL
jgi:T5orf172 domain